MEMEYNEDITVFVHVGPGPGLQAPVRTDYVTATLRLGKSCHPRRLLPISELKVHRILFNIGDTARPSLKLPRANSSASEHNGLLQDPLDISATWQSIVLWFCYKIGTVNPYAREVFDY
jgi:hypothetical protein